MEKLFRKYSGEKFELLYELANQFLELGKRGFENKETNEPMPFASIVNLAFSAELFLKYIHETYGKPRGGHELDKLLKWLNDDDRKHILSQLTLICLVKGKANEVKGDKLFILLKNHSNLFVDFRYLHQKMDVAFKSNKIDFGFILDFIYVVKAVCDKLRNKNQHQPENP